MFGFLKGNSLDPSYRSLYARACQCNFSNNGRLASPFHSYEAVTLFSLACDLGIIRLPNSQDPTCCKLRQRTPQEKREIEVGQFCSAFGMLLLQIKLQDDWADDRSLTSKIALRIFDKPIQRATNYFRSIDTAFESTIATILQTHQDLERRGSNVSLAQFQSATRAGFAYIFRLFALRFAPIQLANLEQIGGELGASIIAFDCAADWPEDQRRRRYNPLANVVEVRQAFEECARCLARASWLCRQLSEEEDQPLFADTIIRKSMRRSLHLVEQRTSAGIQGRSQERTPVLGRSHALRRGDCDICCAIEACDLGCGACEAGGSAFELGLCCDPGCCGATCCDSKKKNRSQSSTKTLEQSNKSELRELIGTQGETSGPLNPAGLVTIKNKTHPASSRSGLYIDAGVKVLIVDIDGYGLKVIPCD